MESLLYPLLNLSILLGTLFYFLRKPAGEFLVNRHRTVRDDIGFASEKLAAAKEDFENQTSKLKAIEAEIDSIKNQEIQDAQAEKTRLIENANRSARTMVSDAKEAAESRLHELEGSIRTEFGMLVVDRAEVLLKERATGPVKKKFLQDFSNEMKRPRLGEDSSAGSDREWKGGSK